MTTKLDKLTAYIQENCPHLMEISEGQRFRYEPENNHGFKCDALIYCIYGGGQISDTGDYDDVYVEFNSHYNGTETLPIDTVEDFEILGKEPMLNDVLLFFIETLFANSEINNYASNLDLIIEDWILINPYLKDQSEKTINFLCELSGITE